MRSHLSNRSSKVQQSEIRAMSIACKKAGGVNLSQGVCDTETPAPVLSGARLAMENGFNTYTATEGIVQLRKAVAHKEQKEKNLSITAEENVVICSGATGALYATVLATLNPGDGVVIFEPSYGYHTATLSACDIEMSYVRLHPPTWELTQEMVEAAILPNTRALLINTPSNPSGKVFSLEELTMIGELAVKHDLLIFSDEIYEYFVYDGAKHISPASLPELIERTIIIGGFSKTFSITGWRVGYTIAPAEISEAIAQFNDLVYVCAPAPLQGGVEAGITRLRPDYYDSLRSDHLRKRNMFCKAFTDAGLTAFVPNGAYYVLVDLSVIEATTSRERAMIFLDKTGIAGVAGSAFYSDNSGDHLVRFCFAKEMEVIEDAIWRIARFGREINGVR